MIISLIFIGIVQNIDCLTFNTFIKKILLGIRISPADDSSPNGADAPIPPFGPPPTWLHDLKRLVPLQVAFEEEVKEKSDVIADYEAQVTYLFIHRRIKKSQKINGLKLKLS